MRPWGFLRSGAKFASGEPERKRVYPVQAEKLGGDVGRVIGASERPSASSRAAPYLEAIPCVSLGM